MAAFVFLTLGFFLIFLSCNTWRQIRKEKSVPYTLTATVVREKIDLDALQQMKGIQRVSPVLHLESELSVEEYTLKCPIQAVYSRFLNLKFAEGVLFPDNSNMPYLVLNKAAAEAFANQEDKTIAVTANTEVSMKSGELDCKASVCGIFDDESETPAAFMSYDTAIKVLSQSTSKELLLALANKGACADVVRSIRRLGLNASFDENESLRWDLLGQQVWLLALMSIGFTICAYCLNVQNTRYNQAAQHNEESSLLLAGMIAPEVRRIDYLRVAIIGGACLCFSSILACITSIFSFPAFCLCIGVLLIFWLRYGFVSFPSDPYFVG